MKDILQKLSRGQELGQSKIDDLIFGIKDFILDRPRVDFYAGIIGKLDRSLVGRVTLLLHAHMLGERLPEILGYIYSCGMYALVETRGLQDLHYLGKLEKRALMVGINNKNIDELEMGEDQLRLTPEIVAGYREVVGNALIISQSAHRSTADILSSIKVGADAVLVGTALMLSRAPVWTVSSFVEGEGD